MSHFNNLKIKTNSINQNSATFNVLPLSKGFGITLGNALRRTLLSNITGASMFAIKINKVKHEFSAIPGIIEDVTQVILNLKKLVIKIDSSVTDEEINEYKIETWPTLKLHFSGEGAITADKIEVPHGFSIVNKNLIIATSESDKTVFDLEIYATRGKGFRTFSENRLTVNSLGIIPTDSNFSPVLNVAYEVEEIKVSQTESHEQLTVLVSTNGSVNPAEAISEASKILIAHLNFFAELSNTTEVLFVDENVSKEIKNVSIPLIDLGLSVRSLNSLQREGIRDVTQLTEMTVGQLNAIDNLGTKSVREIKGALTKLGLSLKTNKN